MSMENLNKLKQEVYTLWYQEKDKGKKETYQKVLDLIDFAERVKAKLEYISNYFSSML